MRISDWSSDVCSSDLALVAGCSVFYADRVSPTILEAMEVAHSAGAIVYFEPSDLDGDLFDDALALTTILKYSSDRLGPEIDERVAASAVLAIVTSGRSEERRVGKACVSTCSSRWCQDHTKTNRKKIK